MPDPNSIRFHAHALERLEERGASEAEVKDTVRGGEAFPAKFGRTGFRRNFPYARHWRGRWYATKQVVVYAVEEPESWLIITVVTRYF